MEQNKIPSTFIELVFKSGKPISFYAAKLSDVERDIKQILNWRSMHLRKGSLSSIATINIENYEEINISEDELRAFIDDCLIGYEADKYLG